jgi:predicted metalloprotease with PDZ domain
MKRRRSLLLFLVVWPILFITPAALAQEARFQIDYTVRLESVEQQLFHVTADIKNIRQESLDLSLPVWTPGWYTIENYAKNILRFKITNPQGSSLPYTMVRKQTWRVDTKGHERIRVEFDYRATILALNQARIAKDFAFFTGTQLFLMAEGQRNSPSTIRFEIPKGWRIVSALKETSDPMTFTAPDYDTLIDSPTEMGNFDLIRFEAEGKPHYFVSTPAGAFSREKAEKFTQILPRIATTQSEIFGGLPYEKYVYFYFFSRPESNAGGALEHSNSFVAFTSSFNAIDPERMVPTAAHEFFHLWNVKRIRPAEMWPYDYSRENETPLLWVSEGITNYYTNITLRRAGLINSEAFLENVAEAITGVEDSEARNYISPASSSISTWIGYDSPVAFGISYYTQGQNLGALLDLSIIHDTSGTASLDDVMRSLYRDFYQKGKGFSTEDMISVINRLTGRDYHDFYRRYIWGVEVPPYDQILGYAGYRIEKQSRKVPVLNFDAVITPEGIKITRVTPGSAAEDAGLIPGDLLLNVDGVEAERRLDAIRQRLNQRLDQTVKVEIRRAGKEFSLDMKVETRDEPLYRIVDQQQPAPIQLKVRERWINHKDTKTQR